MVSGRLVVAVRQLILIGLMFGGVAFVLSSQQKALYQQAAEALKSLQSLQIDHEKLLENGARIAFESNRTRELMKAHLKQMDAVEQFTKKRNLILKGVKELDPEDTEQTVVELIEERLKISLSSKDVEYAIRMEGTEEPRPILIRFVRLKDKSRVFYKRKNLPKQFTLEDDLSPVQRETRKKLDAYAKRASQSGKVVKWSGGKLLVNGKEVKLKEI